MPLFSATATYSSVHMYIVYVRATHIYGSDTMTNDMLHLGRELGRVCACDDIPAAVSLIIPPLDGTAWGWAAERGRPGHSARSHCSLLCAASASEHS